MYRCIYINFLIEHFSLSSEGGVRRFSLALFAGTFLNGLIDNMIQGGIMKRGASHQAQGG